MCPLLKFNRWFIKKNLYLFCKQFCVRDKISFHLICICICITCPNGFWDFQIETISDNLRWILFRPLTFWVQKKIASFRISVYAPKFLWVYALVRQKVKTKRTIFFQQYLHFDLQFREISLFIFNMNPELNVHRSVHTMHLIHAQFYRL